MKNCIFISPNFPSNYWKFCAELKNNGMRVLGIGDCPYGDLPQPLLESLHEYYRVSSLENYDEVYRAVAFLSTSTAKFPGWSPITNTGWSGTPHCVLHFTSPRASKPRIWTALSKSLQ